MKAKRARSTIPSLIIIIGPTASGKSAVAFELAKLIDGEIISCDSMQIYKYLNIGTAKPSRAQRRSIPHHVIDICYPDESFSAGEFQKCAEKAITKILKKNKIPILVGGTGLYVKTITDGLCPSPPRDSSLRSTFKNLIKKHGGEYLYKKLKRVDPISAKNIHPHNIKRIERALEVYEITGLPLSLWHKNTTKPSYKTRIFGLSWNREILYKKINKRVHDMIEHGFVAEVKKLLAKGYSPNLHSLSSLGYRQIVQFLEGTYTLTEAVNLIQRDTRRYAKRQMTWWRKDKNIRWIKLNAQMNPLKTAKNILLYI